MTFCHPESPLNDVAVPEPSVPVIAIVLAVCNVDAVVALPVNAAVIMLAAKLPEASLNTNVEAVFNAVALLVIVGLPLMSLLKPLPEIAIARVVEVPAAVLMIIPFVISPARGEAELG